MVCQFGPIQSWTDHNPFFVCVVVVGFGVGKCLCCLFLLVCCVCVVGVFRASLPDPLRRTPLRRTPLRRTPLRWPPSAGPPSAGPPSAGPPKISLFFFPLPPQFLFFSPSLVGPFR